MPSYVIAGASRGIGLGFVRKLSSDPQNIIFALVRNPEGSTELQEYVRSDANRHGNIHVLRMDLADRNSISSAAAEVSKLNGGTLDVLINNGAMLHHERNSLLFPDYPDPETMERDMLDFYQTNVVGVAHTINAFRPLLLKNRQDKEPARVLIVTSSMGSPAFATASGSDNCGAYAVSKAALNMVVTKYALASKTKKDNIIFLALSPGLVKTMPGPPEVVDKIYTDIVARIRQTSPEFRGTLSIEQSVDEQLALLSKTTKEESGSMLHSSGESIDSIDSKY